MRDALLDVLLKRPEPRLGLGVGVVVAVALHLAVVPGASVLPVKPLANRQGAPLALGVNLASKPQHRLEIELASKEPAPKKPEQPPPLEDEPRGQVVSLPADKIERPLAADFLAETDQKTERETRARVTGDTPTRTRAPEQGREKQQAVAADSGSATPAPPSTDRDNGGPVGDGGSTSGQALAWDSRDPGGGAEQMALEIPRIQETRAPNLPQSDDGAIKAMPDQQGVDGNASRLRVAMGRLQPTSDVGQGSGVGGIGRVGGGGDDGAPGHVAVPTLSQIQRMAGLPANDHLLLEEDDATSLNAFEWKHATYFNRIADAIRRVWVGGEVLGHSDPDGSVFGFADRVTTVEVSIDEAGNVVDIVIKDPSGVSPLDEEALRSFRVAGPFPNPPPALFKGRERYSFSFGFAVNYNRSSVDLNWRPY